MAPLLQWQKLYRYGHVSFTRYVCIKNIDASLTSSYLLINYDLKDRLIVVCWRCITSAYNSSECEFIAEFIAFK